MFSSTIDELEELRERLRRDVLALDEHAFHGGLRQRSAQLSGDDLARARVEVRLARLIAAVAASGEHCEDGHATVAAWCRATQRWSTAETRVRVRLAHLLSDFPDLADELLDGHLGVAQANTIAKAAANPRCGDQIGAVLPILVDEAGKLSHADFQRLVGHWERIADADGAHRDADHSHRQRRASWGTDDDTGDLSLQLRCGAAQGAQVRAVLDMFALAEFQADWAACRAEHGDAATPDLLRRTDAQRRADAIVAMATAAASTPADAQRPEPLVNIVVDEQTFEQFLRHHAGGADDEPDDHVDGCGDLEDDNFGDHGSDQGHRTDAGADGSDAPPSAALGRPIIDDGIDHLDFDTWLDAGLDPGFGTVGSDGSSGSSGRRSARAPSDGGHRWRGCASTDGHPIPVADAIAAALVGRIRVVVTDRRGVILHMGRKQRLFTGRLREAVMLGAHACIWNGCDRPASSCQADHITDWQHTGSTDIVNGAPLCAHHNRFKNRGFRIHRDDTGHWHTYRPDLTEI